MTELTIEIGKKIRSFRRMRKLTLAELAQLVCKSQSTISKYEKGEISVDIETLYEIAAHCKSMWSSCYLTAARSQICCPRETARHSSMAAHSFMDTCLTAEATA